jgi:hypothetical protein
VRAARKDGSLGRKASGKGTRCKSGTVPPL